MKKKKKDWDSLSKQEKQRLIKIADGLFIPPNMIVSMYESGSLTL